MSSLTPTADLGQPTLPRLLNYRPPQTHDPAGSYARCFADLLKACSDASVGYEGILEVLGRAMCTGLQVVLDGISSSLSLTDVRTVRNDEEWEGADHVYLK